ncbi:hypothetical protein FRC12_009864 [Ceratobasidium sp. 428]|nr:hypothetical protein FRC12_009864 [Ceratobasidium sp. 428]
MSDEPTNKKSREFPPGYFSEEVLLSESELIEDLNSGGALNKIHNKTATAATFRNLVRLLRIPSRFSLVVGYSVIPELMDSLRRCCQQSRPYDSTYGFYCVEAIVCFLGVGVMAEPIIQKWCIDQLEKLPDLDNIFEDHVRLGDFVAHWLPEDERLSREVWKAHTSTGVLAPSLGGFTTEDLHYLVDTLFQDRKQMLWMHSIAGTSPVWWYGIYILAMFNEYTLRDRTLAHMIYAIALRIELNSVGDKHDLLDRVITTIGMRRHESRSARVLAKVTDLEDAKLVLSRYYEYIPTCGKRGGPLVIGMIST